MWWNTNWLYKKSATITNANADYQMTITIGFSSGGDVNLNGRCNTDFSDIRFVNSTEKTELPYWLESKTDSNNAVFWVKTDGAASLYIYYGNTAATTTSNGDTTFIFFDDFENNNLDRWTNPGGCATENTVVYEGTYAVNIPTGSDAISKDKTIDYSVMWHQAVRGQGFAASAIHPYHPTTDTGLVAYWMVPYINKLQHYDSTHGYVAWPSNNVVAVDTWYVIDLAISFGAGGKLKGWKDDLYLGEIPTVDSANATVSSITIIRNQSGSATGKQMWIDVVYLRKYEYGGTEPSWGVFGRELRRAAKSLHLGNQQHILNRMDLAT